MVTKLWYHYLSARVWNAYHAPEIVMLHTIVNLKESTTWIFPNNFFFLKSFNHVLYMNSSNTQYAKRSSIYK